MAVLVEGISVIIKSEVVIERYPGGWKALEQNPPNATLCADNELIRLGFMNPDDVKDFVDSLAAHGIRYLVNGKATDMVVADQLRGFAAPCDWAEFGSINLAGDPKKRVSACLRAGSKSKQVVTPEGWIFEKSLSANHTFVKSGWVPEFMDFLRHEKGMDVYRDLKTGKEVYCGRADVGATKQRGTADEFLSLAAMNGRICPQPDQWNKLWGILPNRRQIGSGWNPPLPLILAAWSETSDTDKRKRFLLHLRWAIDHDAVQKALDYLRALSEDQWHHEKSAIFTTSDRVALWRGGNSNLDFEAEAAAAYARMWNTLDAGHLASFLDERTCYESQQVLQPLIGKKAIMEFHEAKIATVKRTLATHRPFAELAKYQGRPVLVLAQGTRKNLIGTALFEVADGKVKRIDMCIVPSPSDVERTGIYPGLSPEEA